MHKLMLLSICSMLTALSSLQAQEVISGTIRNSVTKEIIPAVSVVAKNTPNGDYSNDQGHFRFSTKSKFPVTLVFSSLGFKTKEIEISSAKPLQVELTPTTILGTEVVVSASRNVQRKIESPVTIERIDNKDIINSPQTNYYNMLQGLKGVDITTSALPSPLSPPAVSIPAAIPISHRSWTEWTIPHQSLNFPWAPLLV